jgi:hypothetical protein
MLRLFRIKSARDFLAIISLIAFLNLVHGCYYYKVTKSVQPPGPELMTLEGINKFIILHVGDSAWQFSNIVADGDTISGLINSFSGHSKYKTADPRYNNQRYKRGSQNDESEVLDEVHIYSTEYIQTSAPGISIPTKAVEKIELYNPAKGSTVASWIFSGLAIGVLVFTVILVIVALTKESCPFIYVFDGSTPKFIGEIYSGAIYPSVERDDYLPLPGPYPQQEDYTIKMTNEVHEIQYTNLIELNVFDHQNDMNVLVDKYGNYQTISDLQMPVEATNLKGRNILEILSAEDSLSYYSDENIKDPAFSDGVVLKFKRPADANTAKLVVKAKNTFWLDYIFARFHELFGKEYDCWVEKQTADLSKKMKNWAVEQKIPLLLYIEKNGKWQFIDYFNVVGPMAAKEDVLSIDISDIDSGFIKLKLEFGFLFWDIDYTAVDYSVNVPVKHRIAKFESAIDNKDQDVKKLLESSDLLYYVQPEIGDGVDMKFTVPEPLDEKQTMILHSRGHYKILMNQTGDQKVRELLAFRRKGHFPQFSNQIFRKQSGLDMQ